MHTQVDVVVVGAGNAALCAALAAAEKGARVLVLERAPKEARGGNSYFTDGAIRFAYRNLEDVRALVELSDDEAARIEVGAYTPEQYVADLMRVNKDKTDLALAQRLAEASFPTMKWLRGHGVRFALLYKNQAFEINGRFHFWGGLIIKTVDQGIGLIRSLVARAEALGVEIRYGARGVQLLKEGERIRGIVVEQDGKTFTVQAGAVVLACGGFEANPELRVKHLGSEWQHAIVRGTPYNTGDGIRMAIEAGAKPYGEYRGCHAIATDLNAPRTGDFTKPGDIYKKHSYPLGIMVNKLGKRFVDEGADFRNYTYAVYGREVLRQPDHMAYQIFDGKVAPLLRDEYTREEATRVEADSLEALASKLDIDREAFLKTVRAYNEAVQEGSFNPHIKDGKGALGITPPKSNWAQRLDTPPFLAFPVTCGITFTFGGLRVNPDAQVLDASGKPIPGLFAAGELVGGLFYENYPGGAGLMSGATFGRIAGSGAAGV